MKINILTLFPEMFDSFVNTSIIGRAVSNNYLEFSLINIRDYSQNKHKKVDDYPFGGGAGMLMTPQPIFDALESLNIDKNHGIIYMSPRGKKLDEKLAKKLSRRSTLTVLCGHYEGVDQRVLDYWNAEEVSIGDYVLTGGELPAMVLIDTVSRLIDGVLSSKISAEEESIYSGLLEYDQYTKPREFRNMKVPEVLLNGNHKLIELWKLEKSLEITLDKRPDILEKYLEYEIEKKNEKEKSKLINEVEKKLKKVYNKG